jgi:hypothetical protein
MSVLAVRQACNWNIYNILLRPPIPESGNQRRDCSRMNSNRSDRQKTTDLIWLCSSDGKSLLPRQAMELSPVGLGKWGRPIKIRNEDIMGLMRERSLCEEDVKNRERWELRVKNTEVEGTPRKLATATQPQFPRIVISLSLTHVTERSSAN